ncbi:MAG: ABC transporter substrate-binding protein [Vicinamibacterales bacterium]
MTRTVKFVLTALLAVACAGALYVSLRVDPAPIEETRGGTLRAVLRDEPTGFNRYLGQPDNSKELLAQLVHERLVRVNRATDAIEPRLAERWTAEPDGVTYTLTLRPGLTYSDGTPFTSADVLFAFEAVYSKAANSSIGTALTIGGKQLEVTAPDAATVRIRFPSPFGPGVRVLDNLPILARHKLEPALRNGTFKEAWGLTTPASEMPGLGPFVIESYLPGRTLTLARNPRYWRKDDRGRQLPYLDRVEFQIVATMDTEVLQLESGAVDLMIFSDVRPEDYARLRALQDQGRLRLADAGVSLDPPMFWFNLDPAAKAADPRRAWLLATDFRRALSHAIDRDAIVNTVYLGAAVPAFGPVTPGNKTWYVPDLPRYAYDPAAARARFSALGFSDTNGDGLLEDKAGRPVRFSIITNRGNTIRERTVAVMQEQLRKTGVTMDITALERGAVIQRILSKDYDAVYFGAESSSTDPSSNLDFWVSSGGFHVWNMGQSKPATDWERQIDELMVRQVATADLAERQRIYADVQRIFAENIPVIYVAAPRVTVAMSPRVMNATPVPLRPTVLWNADVLAVRPGGS